MAALAVGLPLAAYLLFREKAIDSLAVLPFEHAAADPGSEYLSDGISEGIINALSQAPKLSVRSFASVQALKAPRADAGSGGQGTEGAGGADGPGGEAAGTDSG